MNGSDVESTKLGDDSAGRTSFSSILRNTGWLLGGKGVGALLSLAYLAIITRELGVADFGRFALVLSTAQAIAVLVSFESWQIIVRFGQGHLNARNPDALNRLVRFCLLIDIAAALAGCALAAGVALLLGPYLGWSQHLSYAALVFCAVQLLSIRSTPMGILRLFDRFDAGALAETMIPIGRMIGALVVLAAGPSVPAFLAAWAGAEMLCAASYWMLALRTGRGRLGSWRDGRAFAAARENEGITGFLTVTNLNVTLASIGKQVAVLIVGLFTGPTGAGLYRLANQLSQSLTKISSLLSRSIFVELARVHASEGQDQLRALFRQTNRLALIAGAVIIFVILLAGRPLLTLIAGEDFAAAYPLMVLLGIAASIDLVGVSFSPLLMATDGARTSLRITLCTTILLLLLLTVLLPLHGPIGAAAASCAASVVGFVALRWASRRALRRMRRT